MELRLYFDDLEVGHEWVSIGRTVTEADVVNFAGLSSDFNPIHIDHEFARATPFRRPIAHGLLVLSISSGLLQHAPPVHTLAFLGIFDWNFAAPVYPGDTIRVRSRIQELEVRGAGRRGAVTWYHEVINQEGKVVQHGVTRTLVETRRGAHSPLTRSRMTAPAEPNTARSEPSLPT